MSVEALRKMTETGMRKETETAYGEGKDELDELPALLLLLPQLLLLLLLLRSLSDR
jgi:hypothetical protein